MVEVPSSIPIPIFKNAKVRARDAVVTMLQLLVPIHIDIIENEYTLRTLHNKLILISYEHLFYLTFALELAYLAHFVRVEIV